MSESRTLGPIRGRWLTALLCASVLTASAPAHSQGTADEMARRHFDSGAAYLQESDYENALREFAIARRNLPGDFRVRMLLGFTQHRRGELDKAAGLRGRRADGGASEEQ